jgi:hypothetical protein
MHFVINRMMVRFLINIMQKHWLYLWVGMAFLLISGPGCKTLKNIGNAGGKGGKSTLAKTKKERVDFKTISFSGKARLNMPTAAMENASASYRVSIEQDKQMLIRVSYFIEVARILITRDSIFVQDKINKKLIACDFSIAESYTGLQADFDMLQDILLGNYHQIPEEVKLSAESKNPLIFTGTAGGASFAYSIDPVINKVVKIQANNTDKKQASEIAYGEFESFGGTEMPQTTSISVTSPEVLSFSLEHRKVEINPSRISFKLSSLKNYDKEGCP